MRKQLKHDINVWNDYTDTWLKMIMIKMNLNNYLFSSVIWAHKFSIVKYYSAWLAKQMEIPY